MAINMEVCISSSAVWSHPVVQGLPEVRWCCELHGAWMCCVQPLCSTPRDLTLTRVTFSYSSLAPEQTRNSQLHVPEINDFYSVWLTPTGPYIVMVCLKTDILTAHKLPVNFRGLREWE